MRILTNRALLTLSALLFACSVDAPTPKGTDRSSSSRPPSDEAAEDDDAPRVLELTADLPDAAINVPYVAALTTRKSIGKVRFELTWGALPPGLTLSEAGEISGIPSEFGDYAFGVTAEDYQGATGKAEFALEVTRKRWLVYEARPGDTAETRVFAVDLAAPGLPNHELQADDEYDAFSLPPREVVWSDDGRLVALLGSKDAGAALFVIDMSGASPGAARELAAGPTITVHGWAPGATRLAYSLDDTRSLLTIDAADPEDVPQNHGTGDSASWATSEFLLCENQDTGIFTVRFDETGRGETRATLLNERYVVAQSFLSRVLLTHIHNEGAAGNHSILFDLNANASYGVIVDSSRSFIHASPNFRFGAHAPSDDGWAVVQLNPLTTGSLHGVPVSEVVPGSAAHWSPNSQWIVIDGSGGQIARLDDTISVEDPASFQPLGGDDGSLNAPAFSADSRWLQFERPWSGTFPGDDYEPAVQYLVDLDDDPLAPIPILSEPRAESAFSPNSRYFARASNQGDVNRTELFLVTLDDDLAPVKVTHADVAVGNVIENVTFTADSLALIYTDRASGAFLVDPEKAEGGARPQRLTRLTVTAVAEQK